VASEYDELGGWQSFKNGEWFHRLVARALRNYWQSADAGYFRAKYPNDTDDQLARRMTSLACKNATGIGVATGAAMSTNEIVGLLTAGEGGVGIPANLAIAAASIGGEMIGVTHIQLKLLAQLGHLYGVPLDPDDPEDIWTIIAFAVGGSAADMAGAFGMKVGRHVTGRTVRSVFSKETLKATQQLGRIIGVKILQKTLVKYSVPVASIAIGGTWNYVATRSMGRIAREHFKRIVTTTPNGGHEPDGPIIDHDADEPPRGPVWGGAPLPDPAD
jgi:uncharacterized protein (DUF697 family)